MEKDGFTLVDCSIRSHRRKAFRSTISGPSSIAAYGSCCSVAGSRPPSAVELERTTRQIEVNLTACRRKFPREHIERTCHTLHFLLAGRRLAAVRILGIGSFECSLAAAYQLILAECIREKFVIADVSSQEPIASAAELRYLQKCGIRTPPVDDKSTLLAVDGGVTLYYMVHCEHFMYENVLRANWRSNTLRNLIILGNDLRNCGSTIHDLPDLLTTRAFAAMCRPTRLVIPLEPYAFSDTWISCVCVEEEEESRVRNQVDQLELLQLP